MRFGDKSLKNFADLGVLGGRPKKLNTLGVSKFFGVLLKENDHFSAKKITDLQQIKPYYFFSHITVNNRPIWTGNSQRRWCVVGRDVIDFIIVLEQTRFLEITIG